MNNEFNFIGDSAEPREYGPFGIGKDKTYVLTEPSEDAYTAYRNISMRAMKLVEGDTTVSDGGQEADTTLVQKCLFEILPSGARVPTKLDFVRALPRRITFRLYKKVRELGDMDSEQETEEFLTKRIAADQKKLTRLQGKETPAKNE